MSALNKIKPFLHQILSNKVLEILLLSSFFFLPLSLFFNNLFFTVFFVAFNLRLLVFESNTLLNSLQQNKIPIVIYCGPILLALLGCFYTDNLNGAFKDIGRLFPLIFTIPLVFNNPHFFSLILKKIMYALALGCLVAAIYCWGISIGDIFHNNDSITDLFSQSYAYHYLSARIGMHTPYLGLFVSSSVFYLILEVIDKPWKGKNGFKILWVSILFLFLLNLLARTAIFSLVVGVITLFLIKRKYAYLIITIALLSTLASLAYFQDHNFLRDRIFKSVNIFEEQSIFSKKDDRFNRFSASIEVFKEFPLIGPGTAAEDRYRKEIYFKNRDSEAFNENYNAHNQFLEYISTYGLLGGMVFLGILMLLIKEAWYSKNSMVVFLIASFILAGLTESILERSWGVSFYILVLFFIYGQKKLRYETA